MAEFTVNEILERVCHIGDPWGVWATLIAGERRAALVDTCTGMGDLAALVRELTPLPLTVVNTHGHADHMGGDYQFPGALVPAADFPYAAVALSDEVRANVLGVTARRKLIDPGPRRAAVLAADHSRLRPREPGAGFDLGGRTLRAVALPGHTPGSTGFLCPELELLLGGDAVAPMVYLHFPESCCVEEHALLLERVIREVPFRRLLSAHSDRLIPREELPLYLECARCADPARSLPYRDPLFPRYKGVLYAHESRERPGEYAMVVYVPGKERRGDAPKSRVGPDALIGPAVTGKSK